MLTQQGFRDSANQMCQYIHKPFFYRHHYQNNGKQYDRIAVSGNRVFIGIRTFLLQNIYLVANSFLRIEIIL